MKSIRVRIAVAVDPKERWYAVGWEDESDKVLMDTAVDSVDAGENRYFVEATLSVPEKTVTVIKADRIEPTTTPLVEN